MKALQEASYYSAEHGYLDVTMELRAMGVPWKLHVWLESLRCAQQQSRASVTLSLLREFTTIKEEDYCEELSPKNDTIIHQLASIFSHCYGPAPLPSIPEMKATLSAQLDPLFLNNPDMSDVTFIVEGKPFYGHKVLLITASERFRSLLASTSSDGSPSKEINISDVKYNTFQMMMSYLYCGGTESLKTNVPDLLELLSAACLFKLGTLQRHCEVICSKHIHLDNAVNIYKTAKAHGLSELSSFCEGYFLQQMPSMLEREGFRSLLLGPRQVNGSSSTQTNNHRVDCPVEEMESALAQRLHLLYVTSRVPVIKTDLGSVRGGYVEVKDREIGAHTFLGIPFAKPPVGPALRLAPPQPVEKWEGLKDATRQPHLCIQSKAVLEDLYAKVRIKIEIPEVSEDCLYLNIYTPANRLLVPSCLSWSGSMEEGLF
ncbi:hypothetical protein WMY93_023702 [Mugilogobius chulae]|uniref:BTB domain-containing protein n=1 Tax=Mugilogobius chulae TaxID=88201 RepID=A0AAW0NC00_9GOBI